MRINDDLTQPVLLQAESQRWIPSPAAGVDRRMLFRIGAEKARATSIVRYEAGSSFARHAHPGGEEFLVLDGVFQDEHGDYPAGSYIRNPPGTSHAPAAAGGCTIFVRLWQFRADDRTRIVCSPGGGRPDLARPGAEAAAVLYEDEFEKVRLERWRSSARVLVDNPRGLEFFVISGALATGDTLLTAESWGRLPAGMALSAQVSSIGVEIWMKSGPLIHQNVCTLA
jgi:quercetin dioxygenase-like cupin family protein